MGNVREALEEGATRADVLGHTGIASFLRAELARAAEGEGKG